jgi:hypothetical protein
MNGQPSRDQLIESLAALAREAETARPEGLPLAQEDVEALVQGTLPAERLAELQRDARADPDVAAALACFTPLAAADRDQIASKALAQVRGGERRRAAARRARLGWLSVPVLAAAAAGLALLAWPGRQPMGLPAYDLQLTGGDAVVRGQSAQQPRAAAVRLWPDAAMDLVMRPESAVAGPLQASAFVRAAGHISPLALPFELSEVGAVRVSGPVGELFAGLHGSVELVIVLRRPDVSGVPAALELAAGAPASGPGWVRLSTALELAGPAR